MFILYTLISNSRNLSFGTDPYIHTRLKVAPRLRFRGAFFRLNFEVVLTELHGAKLAKMTTCQKQILIHIL